MAVRVLYRATVLRRVGSRVMVDTVCCLEQDRIWRD